MRDGDVDDFWPIREISAPPTVKNADNGWLGELGGMLEVSMVNGTCAREVPEFKPTRHELFMLAKYWAETAIAIEYSWFNNEKRLGNSALRRRFARERLKRIRTILGTDVDVAINAVLESYGAKQNQPEWAAFLYGSEERQTVMTHPF